MDDLELWQAKGDAIRAADLYDALRLRAEVFVVEQTCVYLDPDGRDLEPGTTHLWLRARDGTLAAYLRVLSEPGGGHRIGRVVTAPGHRGQQLSARLIDIALEDAHDPVVLDAQSQLVAMYARSGFEVDGPAFIEDGISHTPMRLTRP